MNSLDVRLPAWGAHTAGHAPAPRPPLHLCEPRPPAGSYSQSPGCPCTEWVERPAILPKGCQDQEGCKLSAWYRPCVSNYY